MSGGVRAASWLALAVGGLIFLSPLRALWVGGPWWSIFVPWAALVIVGAFLARRMPR
tara:strand:- start:1093 stop:1263 length:171 start_codon:yes stop_codon:yes gene_type:complete